MTKKPQDELPLDAQQEEVPGENQEERPQEVQAGEAAEDGSAALQKQLDDLRRSESLHKSRAEQAERERAEALRRAEQREAEIVRFQEEAQQSKSDVISTALSAAQAEAETAQREIEQAVMNADPQAQAAAYRKLAKAEANVARLEDGKAALEEQKKAAPKPQQQSVEDPLEKTNLPDLAKTWLRAHPDYLSDPRKNAKIQALHWDVLDEGHAAFSQPYFDSLEQHLGLKEKTQPRREESEERVQVSAPVSRENPSASSGRRTSQIRLTAAEKDIARRAGISEEEYAKNKIKLEQMKASGEYAQ